MLLAFVRSGYIYPSSGAGYVGGSGYGWSRTAGSSANAYHLSLYPTSVSSSTNDGRYHGFPLRCLYPGSA